MLLLLGRDAHAGVANFENRVAPRGACPHVHAAALRRELDRVRDEVVEELGEPRSVAREQRRAGSCASVERDLLVLGERPCGLDGLCRDGREVDGADLEGELACLDLCQEEQVAHELEQPVRVPLDDAEKLALLVGDLARLAIEHELEVAADRGQRSPELVRDERDELVLQPVELEQALVAHLELARELLTLLLQPPAVGDVLCDRATPTTSPSLLRTADMVTAMSIESSVLAPSRHFETALADLDHRGDARARIRRVPFRDED